MTDPTDACAEARRLIDSGQPARGLRLLDALLGRDPGDAAGWYQRGRALNNLGRAAEAAGSLQRAVELDPTLATAWAALGHVRTRLGEDDASADAWRRALAVNPREPRALAGLGRAAAGAGRLAEAADWMARAAEAEPADARHWMNLAELNQFLDRPAEATRAWRRATEAAPGLAAAWSGLGRCLQSQGDVSAAAGAFRSALAADPRDAETAADLALCLEVLGELEAARACLAPHDRSDAAPAVLHATGRLLKATGRPDEAAARIRRSLEAGDEGWRRLPAGWFSLGEALDAAGDAPGAFDAWARAKALKPTDFDADAYRRRVAGLVAWFDTDRIAHWPASAAPEFRPVFIVGMPRSGTTLVEQVLACHAGVRAGGERLVLDAIADERHSAGEPPAPEDEAEAAPLRARALAGWWTPAMTAPCPTDKFPGNFLHLGLARRLFPQARVIWCRRDAGDTALSIFAHDFNRRLVPWAARLEDIAVAWRCQERLMTHWCAVLGLPVLEVAYESLVADFEAGVRRLLAFLDLPWEPACLDFHASGRLANTASYAQVRRPLYATSVGRHRPYAAMLAPFFRALGAPPAD